MKQRCWSWALCAVVTGGVTLLGSGSRQTAASNQATGGLVCISIGVEPERTWTFEPVDGTWRVTHTAAGQSRKVSLVLPGATAAFTRERIDLRARTANGGIDVTLSGSPERATLDAYVNYELEVNVDVSLTPDIDAIATDAPTGVRCVPTP